MARTAAGGLWAPTANSQRRRTRQAATGQELSCRPRKTPRGNGASARRLPDVQRKATLDPTHPGCRSAAGRPLASPCPLTLSVPICRSKQTPPDCRGERCEAGRRRSVRSTVALDARGRTCPIPSRHWSQRQTSIGSTQRQKAQRKAELENHQTEAGRGPESLTGRGLFVSTSGCSGCQHRIP